MTDNKSIGISSLITLGLILSSMVIPGFFDEPQYYCEIESSIKECPGNLSSTFTRCYLNEEKSSWDYCRSKWILVTDDLIIQEEPKENQVGSGLGIKVWECDINNCTLIE